MMYLGYSWPVCPWYEMTTMSVASPVLHLKILSLTLNDTVTHALIHILSLE
jgi:hypothetical protein